MDYLQLEASVLALRVITNMIYLDSLKTHKELALNKGFSTSVLWSFEVEILCWGHSPVHCGMLGPELASTLSVLVAPSHL